jgi:hypothetical protein
LIALGLDTAVARLFPSLSKLASEQPDQRIEDEDDPDPEYGYACQIRIQD